MPVSCPEINGSEGGNVIFIFYFIFVLFFFFFFFFQLRCAFVALPDYALLA